MTKAEKLQKAKEIVFANFASILEEQEAIQVDEFAFAVQTEVDGQEIFVEVKLTAKNFTATKNAPAYNPIDANEDFEFTKAQRAKREAEKLAEKEKKARARAKAKDKTEAEPTSEAKAD